MISGGSKRVFRSRRSNKFSFNNCSICSSSARSLTVSSDRPALSRRTGQGTETILVADDDVSLRELAEKLLSQFGYKVITAEDGQDALNKFRMNKDNISLVILDVIMAKM